ncbi:hypothetical protein OG226_46260 [Streptomyces sp. NBC_01261]
MIIAGSSGAGKTVLLQTLAGLQAPASGAANGYDSPTRRSAAVAFAVNTTVYSAGSAWKCRSTAARVRASRSPEAREAGLSE